MGKTNFEISLLKSKSKSELKNKKLNPNRLDSYLLDSIWKNLQRSNNTGARNPTFQNFQPCTPLVAQNHPTFKSLGTMVQETFLFKTFNLVPLQ